MLDTSTGGSWPLAGRAAAPHGEPVPSAVVDRLIAAVQRLSLARDLETVMTIVRTTARALTGADGATFILRDRDQCYYADEDAIGPLWKGRRFPMSDCISGWVMANKRPAVVADIYADPRVPADAYRPTFVRSLAVVPIRAEAPVGAIGTYWATHHMASDDEVKLLQSLANSTSIAIENVRLYAELERRVEERTAQLEAMNQELEAFSYSVSHDLRTPLHLVSGWTSILLDKEAGRLDEGARGMLRSIDEAARSMDQLIDDILRLSRIARAEVKKEPVHLSGMVHEVLGAFQDGTRAVECVVEPGHYAHGDPHLLRVALTNLLSNAWKFTSKAPHARIVFGARRGPEGQAVYFVQDDGAGFDATHADRLFRPFQRLHSEVEFPGTGVGLATVERIIRKHGGRIWAESAAGKGARFSFTLPAD